MEQAVFGSKGTSHALARFVDAEEAYGAHIVARMVAGLPNVGIALDLGAGGGRDLSLVKRHHPSVRLAALEVNEGYSPRLRKIVDELHVANLERDALPFADESLDLIIANQVLEHTKEIFWIFHEVTRCLKVGGHFLIGVPNVASFHNRILMLFGQQPTQHKLCSAHVRPFSKRDTMIFVNQCFPKGYELAAFGGAQFYPFPKALSRLASTLFPSGSVSIFFLLKKVASYQDLFITYPGRANFQSNFYCGPHSPFGKREY